MDKDPEQRRRRHADRGDIGTHVAQQRLEEGHFRLASSDVAAPQCTLGSVKKSVNGVGIYNSLGRHLNFLFLRGPREISRRGIGDGELRLLLLLFLPSRRRERWVWPFGWQAFNQGFSQSDEDFFGNPEGLGEAGFAFKPESRFF